MQGLRVFGSRIGWFPRCFFFPGSPAEVFSVSGSVFSVPADVFSSCDGVFRFLPLKKEMRGWCFWFSRPVFSVSVSGVQLFRVKWWVLCCRGTTQKNFYEDRNKQKATTTTTIAKGADPKTKHRSETGDEFLSSCSQHRTSRTKLHSACWLAGIPQRCNACQHERD